ncbi:hypothetical protein EMCRGX_G012056 [Ephydatia muelleri]
MTSKVFSVRPILLALTTSCFSTMLSYALGSEVLITPPLSAKEALGGTASFTCTVTAMQDSLPVDWYIQLANGNAYYWSLHFPVLQAMGFALDGTAGPATSTLHVLANTETNGTWVQCIATRSQGDVATSNSSSLFVFGCPSPPTNLSLLAVGERTLRFAWIPTFAPAGVTTWYRVIVRDDATRKVILNSSVGGNASYEYHHDGTSGESLCHTYTFSVMASNAAGNGDISESLATTIPAAPRFSTATVLRVSFNPASIHYSIIPPNVCPDFPVKGYLLKIRNAIDGSTVNLGPFVPNSNFSTFHIDVPLSSGLQKESMYNSTIEAFNAVGGCTTSLVLYTTDVQSATITGDDHQLNVTCFLAEGTLAKGCVVYLENSGNVLQQKLPRTNMAANGMIRTQFSVDCYNISVVDWEEDGSIGPLNIPTTINIKTHTNCDTSTLQHSLWLDTHSFQNGIYFVTAAAFVTIFGLLVLIIILVAILIYYTRKSKKKVSNERNESKTRFRSQMSTSSDSYLISTPPSTPLSSNEQTCPFPAPQLDKCQNTAKSTKDDWSSSSQL